VRHVGTETVIACEGMSVELDGARVLEDVTFAVHRGEFVGLVGPNGAGKTTLLKALLGLVPVSSGSVQVFGHPPGRRAAERRVGYVPQRQAIPPTFPATVLEVVAMGALRGSGLAPRSRRRAREHALRALERVGIQELADRPVGRLSGGQQRRAMLAQALCASRELLVLDEPTIGLDLPAEHEFYGLLRELQRELSLTTVAVSHDLVALAGECDELICINRHMHVHGNPEDVIHSHALHEAYSCEFDFLAGEIAHHARAGPDRPSGPPES